MVRRSQEAEYTQPRDHILSNPCTQAVASSSYLSLLVYSLLFTIEFFYRLTSLGGVRPGPSQQASSKGLVGNSQVAEGGTRGAVAVWSMEH